MSRPCVRIERVIALLKSYGPSTGLELAELLGIKSSSLNASIRDWRKNNPGVIRIVGWERKLETGGRPAPMWDLGSSRDADKPKKLPQKEVNRRSYVNNRAERITAAAARRAAAGKPRKAPPWLRGLV